jgi:hypothetical protein
MRGKWAAGIKPRNFMWIITDRLAICERPGGYARNHRKVRRQEEIIWIREQGFTRVVSLLASPHNLQAYEELGLPYVHIPFGPQADSRAVLPDLFQQMKGWLKAGDKVLVHMEEVSDRLIGTMGAYLLWAGMVDSEPQAITIMESISHQQLGTPGRALIALVREL